MKKIVSFSLAFCLSSAMSMAQVLPANNIETQSPTTPPLHEMRGVWLTTIGGIDWPHSYAQSDYSISRQKQELCQILDKLVRAGINTVFLQTRVRGTTIFPSNMEPWDGCLSGLPGKSPGYDPLSFAIEECHRRGMKLHAWVVTIPIGRVNGAGAKNLMATHSQLVKKRGDEAFMDPENPATATYLATFCRDITQRYDIDGIHLDYIRYPETWGKVTDRYQAMQNITRIVREISVAVKERKPWVMMSCSPVGKYADTRRQNSRGWNARDAVYQDAAQWLQSGLMDAVIPMMYFKDENYYPFAIDWKERSAGKIVVPGLGIYFMHPSEKNWNLVDITREMHVNRQYGMGTCFFRSKFFTDNTKGLYDYTLGGFSSQPALQPAMRWYNVALPSPPANVRLEKYNAAMYLLTWGNTNRFQTSYNVYGSKIYPVDTSNPANLLMSEYNRTSITVPSKGTVLYYAVTATDRYGNESAATQLGSSRSATNAENRVGKPLPKGMIPVQGNKLILSGYDIESGTLVTFNSNVTNAVKSSFTHCQNGIVTADVSGLQPGHYTLRLVNKKGHSHLVGRFAIEVSNNYNTSYLWNR